MLSDAWLWVFSARCMAFQVVFPADNMSAKPSRIDCMPASLPYLYYLLAVSQPSSKHILASSTPTTRPHLANERPRSRNRIARRHRPVQLELDPRIRSFVRTREADRCRVTVPAACDGDLRALHIQLRSGVARCGMQRDEFGAEEVSGNLSGGLWVLRRR